MEASLPTTIKTPAGGIAKWLASPVAKDRLTSLANIGPNLSHQSLTVSWQMSIPRLNSGSSTFLRLSGNRTYISTTSGITSDDELTQRKGLAGLREREMALP